MRDVELTDELIESGMSARGGWTKAQLAVFGVGWPPKKGWKRRLVGTFVTSEQFGEFLAHLRTDNYREVKP